MENKLFKLPANALRQGVIPFDLYAENTRGELVLFCTAGYRLDAAQHELLTVQGRALYIVEADISSYLDFSFENYTRMICNEALPLPERSQALHDLPRISERLILEMPEQDEGYRHAEHAVEYTLQLLLGHREAASQLFVLSDLDPYTVSHALNVGILNILIAQKTGMDDQEHLWDLGMSGLLHDIGKTMIPEELLKKQGELQEDERQILNSHSLYGYEIAIQKKEIIGTEVALGIRGHHERWNGGGYPDNLRGERIHPYARITAVSDVFDAMTSSRPYSEKMTDLEALRYICSDSGMFDPDYTHALLERSVLNA